MLDLADIVFGDATTDSQVVDKKPHQIIMTVRNLVGDSSTRSSQGHIAPLDMRYQTEMGQTLNGPGDGRESGTQFGGDIGHPHPYALLLKAKNDFNIILLAGG